MKRKERTTLEVIKRFFEPVFAFKMLSIRYALPPMITSVLSILSIYLIKDITNMLEWWLSNDVINLLIIFVLLILFNYLVIYFSRNWTHWIMWPIFRGYFYRKNINDYTLLNNNEVEKQWTGRLIATIDKWMHVWVELVTNFIEQVIPNFISVFLSFVFIYFINPYYSFIIFITLIIVFIITYFVQNVTKFFRRERKKSNIGVTRKFVKVLMSKFEILQNNKWEREWLEIVERLKVNILLNKKIRNREIFIELLVKILTDWSRVAIIILYWIWFWTWVINFWEFVSLMSITYVLDQILSNSIRLYIDFNKRYVDIEKLWDFFDNTPNIKWYTRWKKFIHKKWKFEIKNLSFWYSRGNKIFDNFSLKIEWEKVLALVWNSWWGKSTLAKLLSGYIRANKWDIIIDNQKINSISLKSYYKDIWYLTQEPSVFDGTILDNLTYAIDRNLEDNEVEKIIEFAKCEFIYDLPKWLETEIWERGVKLSWWQKQRLAIAKIFLKDPKIIILDEPTSALDSFSEERITKALHNLFKWRTVIIIAHRLQTVKHADRILVLENWKIIEDWNHKSLMKNKWHYAKMLKLQSGF